ETFADRAHHVRQQVGAQCRENAQRDRAGFGIAVAMRDALDLLDFVQHLAGTRDDLPPASVSNTLRGVRSTSVTLSSSSSFLICVESVGWLTKLAAAARPKCL